MSLKKHENKVEGKHTNTEWSRFLKTTAPLKKEKKKVIISRKKIGSNGQGLSHV